MKLPQHCQLPFLAALLLCCGADANAQLNALEGQSSIKLLVETIDEEAKSCGISEDALDASMRIQLSRSPMKVVSAGAAPYLYANVTAVRIGAGGCAVSVALSFNRYMWVAPRANSDGVVATTWKKSAILTGGSADTGRRVANTVEDMTKLFIAAWLKEN